MARLKFEEFNFRPYRLEIIRQANEILADPKYAGNVFTQRQLYYQFVARGLMENTFRNYKNLCNTINDGRRAGLIDWDAIEDRTRSLTTWVHRKDPLDAIRRARKQYGIDRWLTQPTRVEVWIEKEALAGVIQRVCGQWDVPFFACRGYVSESELFDAGRRARQAWILRKQPTTIIHLGDHDPSGIDMSRDNLVRTSLFSGQMCAKHMKLKRIALNWDQIEEFNPPANYAKVKDARFQAYLEEFGEESWELDALDPPTLNGLITDAIEKEIDEDDWEETGEVLADDLERMDEIIEQLETEEEE